MSTFPNLYPYKRYVTQPNKYKYNNELAESFWICLWQHQLAWWVMLLHICLEEEVIWDIWWYKTHELSFLCLIDLRLNAAITILLDSCSPEALNVLLSEISEAQWEFCFFPHLSFHGASLRYFHLFWERRSIIRNATETTQAHTKPLIPLHLSHQIVQGRKNFCDKASPIPREAILSN